MFVPAQSHDAFDTCQPFSRAEARAAGLTAEMLLSKRFHKIFWDTYISRDLRITQLVRAKALIRLVPPESYISHHTAAELWGAAPPADAATHITLPSASDAWFAKECNRTIGNIPRKPRFARACPSLRQSRPSWTLPRLASDSSISS
jgi:hypothetical protein